MKMPPLLVRAAALVLALAGAGCAGRDLDRKGIERRAAIRLPPPREGRAEAPPPAPPVRIGVYFDPFHHAMVNDRYVEWTAAEKDRILGALEELKDRGLVAAAFPLADPRIEERPRVLDLQVLSQVAAREDAAAILVVHGAGDVDQCPNPFAVLYIVPLLGILVSPGTTLDAVFEVRGTLLDPGASRALFIAKGVGERRAMAPLLFVNSRRAVGRARAAAIGDLVEDLKGKLATLAGAGTAERSGSP